MRNKVRYGCYVLLASTMLACMMLAGCSNGGKQASPTAKGYSDASPAPASGKGNTPSSTSDAASSPSSSKAPVSTPDPIKEQIKKMTLDDKIGQLVLVGIEGISINDHTKNLIQQTHVGGVIVYKENVKSAAQLTTLLNEMKDANRSNPVPLFLSVDQEGGSVSRMPDEFEKFPTNQYIGKINSPSYSKKIGAAIADEIKSVGFNMDFAPVLDINSNPANPVIGDRSFGSTPTLVSSLGLQTMLGIQSRHVIAVVKHFPGHGDTSVDSHLDLPIVRNSLDRLRKFEWIPFANAINHQADAVMIAHILLPQIDPDHPASFSKTIITDLLRNELHYNGVVITDDMTMGGIVKHYDMKQAAVQSILAGSDIILVAHGYDQEVEVISNIRKSVENGTISLERLDRSVYRILQLKRKYLLSNDRAASPNVEAVNANIHKVLSSK